MAGGFTAEVVDGAARAGRWATPDGEMLTPGLLLYSRRGGLLTLTPDMRDRLRPAAAGCSLSVVQFLEAPGPAIVKEGGGAKKFLAMDGLVTIANSRDCMVNEYALTGKRQTDSVSVSVQAGSQKVTAEDYMRVVEALRPTAYVTLPDELPRAVTQTRTRKSVERSAQWMTECLALHASLGLHGTLALSPVMGGGHVEEREQSSQLAGAGATHGFALCGFGCGETDAERPALITAALKHLPAGKPRFLSGLGTPLQIMDAVQAGADIFDCWYIGALSSQGLALHFPVDPRATTESSAAPSQAAAHSGRDFLKINLYSTEHRTDRSPLLAGCQCFACQNHSRAYIHHLLSVHEMLGAVLLEAHNTHHMLAFFAAMRRAIQEKALGAYKQAFYRLQERFYIGG
eukprot:jgi/Tetstr1/453863/TSEL_040785.t1